MVLRSYVLIVLLLQMLCAHAGNEWIQHKQQYFKFPITAQGIYRITSADLQSAGISTGDFDPRNLQIFRTGAEIPLFVNTEGDGVFQSDDYIEFVAFPNDGLPDSSYYTQNNQVNPYLSLYNDTAWYFLTWNNSLKNLRFANVPVGADGAAASYCYDVVHRNFANRFNYPESLPDYGAAEAYTGPVFGKGTTKTENFILAGYAPATGVETSCQFSLATVSSFAHIVSLQFAGSEQRLENYGFKTQRGSISGLVSDDGKAVFSASIPMGTHASADNQAISFLRVTYPRRLVAKTDSATDGYLPKVGTGAYKSAVFTGMRKGSAVLYDISSIQRASVPVSTTGEARFVTSNTEKNHIFISSSGSYRSVKGLAPIQSKNTSSGRFADFSRLANQGNYIIITHNSLWQAAHEYADYRSQSGYSTVVVDIDELYNQFGFGINKHPIGIHDFAEYAYTHWGVRPEYIFIIGKGIHAANYRFNTTNYRNCLVPSAGSPSSDMMNFAGIGGARLSQPFKVGRLAARNPEQVRLYLNKVMQHEQQELAEWMKTVLHFGGGGDVYEQQLFESYLRNMENIIEGDSCGATVYTTLKNSSDPLQITQTDMVRNSIEKGVNMMTFFGHASSGSFDQSIDEPTYFNNKGRYPLILANSCYSGDIYTPESTSISERWLLIENKGAIAFAASVGPGSAYYLNRFSSLFYTNLSKGYYGKSIATSINAAVNTFVYNNDGDVMVLSAAEMELHGDPAVKIHQSELPDLVAGQSSFIMPDTRITADADTFRVSVTVLNIGKTFSDSVAIELVRTLPNGTKQIAVRTIAGVRYRDTVEFSFATGGLSAAGNNKLELTLDKLYAVGEANEQNNTASIQFTVISRHLVPVYPEEFAIVPSTDVALSASALNPSDFGGICYFEIDTDHAFASAGKQSATVSYDNSLIRWRPTGLQADMTYYWRVGTRKESHLPIDWNASSFRIEQGKTGWAQYGYGQANGNLFTYCEYDDSEKLNFTPARQMLTCVSVGSASNDLAYNQTQFRIDGNKIGSSGCGAYPFITVAVIDPVSLMAWDAKAKDYGHYNFSPSCIFKHDYFQFSPTNPAQKTAFARFISDSIPDGNYVLVYTFITGRFKSWDENMYVAMEQLGATSVRSLPDNSPYIFLVKKGDYKSVREVIGETNTSTIELSARLESTAAYGWMESPRIGPSPNWEDAVWHWDLSGADSSSTKIVGILADGTEYPLADSLIDGGYEFLQHDIHSIKIRSYISDFASKSAPAFDFWKVYYTPVPETALNLGHQFVFHADTLTEGDSLRLSIATENISAADMDSLLVRYVLRDAKNSVLRVSDERQAPHPAGSIAVGTAAFATAGMSGNYVIKAEFNPEILLSGQYDQYERHHFNNIYEQPFYVASDRTNPLLSVMFDGARILSGEIVSAKPVISIEVYDENKFFLIDDTASVEVYISSQSLKSTTEQRVFFADSLGREQIRFTPATAENGKATLLYSPTFAQDGMYTLRIKAWDSKRNISEAADYKVLFQIVNSSSITHLFNYPNPFSTSTRFVFTLTGSQLPDDLRVQVMTVSGKLVREITMAELGPLRIGNNITHYAWDGTDMYGDRLANGVYYYRVFTKLMGAEMEHRASAADNVFKKGYGKMVLIR